MEIDQSLAGWPAQYYRKKHALLPVFMAENLKITDTNQLWVIYQEQNYFWFNIKLDNYYERNNWHA